ncbi:MAG: DUF4105 domain-containing protein [Pseudomonadota bacterium]
MLNLSRRFLLGLLAALFLAGVSVAMKSPRTDREWATQFQNVASFENPEPFQYKLRNLRKFEYHPDGSVEERWGQVNLNTENLVEAWFFVEPFPASDLFGHTFISFVFDNGDGTHDTVSVSVEARKEQGENYSAILGVFREYELSYVWSTEKDVSTRIAVSLDHPLYAYKINQENNQAQIIFDHFVQRTNSLVEKPRFYNTVFSNCTNELFKAVNEAFPGSVPRNPTWLLTGRSAQYLHASGYLSDKSVSFDDVKARARVDEFMREAAGLPERDFSRKWREAHERSK